MRVAVPWTLCHLPPLCPVTYEFSLTTCNIFLKQCRALRDVKVIHGAMTRKHIHLNFFFCTNLVSLYASFRSIRYAFSLFALCGCSDVSLWNITIRAFVENGFFQESISLYYRMLGLNIVPDNFTFPLIFKALANLQNVEEGKKIHQDAVAFGYGSDVFVSNSLIAMYGKCCHPPLSRHVFDNMPMRNVISWSSMIGAYAQSHCHENGIALFREMHAESIRPNRVTILNLVPCISRLNEAAEVHQLVLENHLDRDIRVKNALICMYAKCKRIDICQKIFSEIREKDLVSWSSMIGAFAQADLPIEALTLFNKMILQSIQPDFVTVLSIVRACSSLASLMHAKFLHGFIFRYMGERGLVLDTSMIDLYVKCGNVLYARHIFDGMEVKNLISWSTMISGYGMHGQGRESIQLFDQMKYTVQPDDIVFVSVLSACSHAGLVEEGWKYFNSMQCDFQIVPKTEHYACMVDLLSRAGKLNEAHAFIRKMPVKPHTGVWGSLLGACRIHSDANLAELAAKELLKLDPQNSGRYVLLSSIYLASGEKFKADCVRALMQQRHVKKIAGHTIIEVRNKLYKFTAGNNLNPQMDLIYSELEKLMARIREQGYTPDINLVMHDVEEEAKEKMLSVHSEKLAVVFGLLNLHPEGIIRLVKNLRVCGDCHTAMKYISKVTRRYIVMRDAHRFHHFKDGSCSCGDYW